MLTIHLKGTSSVVIVNVDGTDENADWIKTNENRKSEKTIHDSLAKKHKLSGGKS
jgi:hypothetical protein